jgi:predicted transcriptional regulator
MTKKKDTRIDLYGFFLELGSPIRLRMLHILSEGIGYRNSELAKKLKISPQENLRHLGKLRDHGLVVQEGREYILSQIGRLLLEGILPQINFLIRNSDFFQLHDFSVIPPILTKRLAELVDCQILKGATAIIAKAEDIITNANKQIWDIAKLVTTNTSSLIASKKGLDIRALVEKGSEASTKTIIGQERRAIDHIDLGMVMSEREAYLRFPVSLTGDLSLNHALYGNDLNFINFCEDLFSFYWEQSDPVTDF